MDDFNETGTTDTPARRGGGSGLIAWILVIALLSFSAGMIMNPWFERNVRTRLPGIAQEADLGAVSARLEQQQSSITQLETRVSGLEQRPAALPGIGDPAPAVIPDSDEPPALNDPVAPALAANLATDRVARIESRVDAMDRQQVALSGRVDNLSAEVAGLTVRVEDSRGEAAGRMAEAERMAAGARSVLLLGRARAAFEAGEPLGALSPPLRAALGQESDEDLDRLNAGMRDLVQPQALKRRFERLAPALLGAAEDNSGDGWWTRFTSELAGIFTIRRTGAEDSAGENEKLVTAIRAALEAGEVDKAVQLYARLPKQVRDLGARWWLDAANYARTEAVLERLEARVVSDAPPVGAPVPAAPTPATPL